MRKRGRRKRKRLFIEYQERKRRRWEHRETRRRSVIDNQEKMCLIIF
jgi:hypothetical protein